MNETTQLDSLAGIVNESTSMSLFELLSQGGILMIPIFLLSLVALYVVIERLLVLNGSKVQIDDFLTDVEGHMKRGEPRLAIQYCEDMDKPLSRIVKGGLSRLGRSLRDIEEGIHTAAKKEIFYLQNRLHWLATIAGVAPLLGFTGTVTGMIRAFMELQSLQGNANPSVLAGGIWEALITTAFGLIVGIIAFGFYNYLVSRVDRLIFELENASADFMELLQSPAQSGAKQATPANPSSQG